jgi:hypothetical protein
MKSTRILALVACALLAGASAFAPDVAAALAVDPSMLALAAVGMTTFTEGNHAGEHIISEASGTRSRDIVTLASGNDLEAGTVLGKVAVGAGVAAADAGNTGDGTVTGIAVGADGQIGVYALECTASPAGAITTAANGTAGGGNAGATTMTGVTAGAAVKAGTYNMVCTDATVGGSEVFQVTDPDGLLLAPATVGVAYVNAQIEFTINDPGANAQVGDSFSVLASAADGNVGTFAVKAPDGAALPDATVGVAYANDQLAFTINDGATDFAVGDKFTITVADGSAKFGALDLTKANGMQVASAVLYDAVDASGGDKPAVVTSRDSEVATAKLTWPAGITNGEKTAALAQLAALGIIAR